MFCFKRFLVMSFVFFIQFVLSEASYRCGIRQHGFLPLSHYGWEVEKGHWPWHAALFHRHDGVGFEYGCGGTLVNRRHVLTAAHCVVKRQAKKSLPAIMYEIELHFGQHNLSEVTDDVVIRDVGKAHVHPEYAAQRNDIAVLVMRLAVEYSDYVIPICLDQKVDRDLRELEGRRGWVTGWGTTENGTISEVLRTLSVPVVDYVQCLKDDRILFGNLINENVFCAGNRNGTSPAQGDSGGGLYVSDGDRWVLRGIVSTGKVNREGQVDPYKYTVFVNVQQYLTWIKEVFRENEPRKDRRQKRISEIECERFQNLTARRRNGDCLNNRYPHNVMVIHPGGNLMCNGVLVDENNVLATCSCIRFNFPPHFRPAKVRIEGFGEVTIAEMFCHPKYHYSTFHYDLAILKLNRTIPLSSKLIPACLASNWTENLYDILLQTAYAYEPTLDHLTLVESDENRIATNEKCSNSLRPNLTGEICVVNSDQFIHSGILDSVGDALQSFNRRSCVFTLIGVKAFSPYSQVPGTSTVDFIYTRISHHIDWVEQSIWNVQPNERTIRCGIPYHLWTSGSDGEWPWSVAIFHWKPNGGVLEFACSGTLISKKHILTTAQCVMNQTTDSSLPVNAFELRFGTKSLTEHDFDVQIRYVSEVHIHEGYSVHDVAILVTSWPLKISTLVAPICIAPANGSDVSSLENTATFISGWATIEPAVPNDTRQSEYIPILGHELCSEASPVIFGNRSSSNMFCSVHDEESKINIADRGSGVYHSTKLISDWTLVGIASSKIRGNDTKNYTLIVNVKQYIPWIKAMMTGSEGRPKRISERDCARFSNLSRKNNGVCENAGNVTAGFNPHIVSLLNDEREIICSGVLVKEDRVLTTCQCTGGSNHPTKVRVLNYDAVDISAIICHPDYKVDDHHHDLAVLKLASSFELTSQVIPACLGNTWADDLLKDPVEHCGYTVEAKEPRRRYESVFAKTKEECESTLLPHDRRLERSQFCVFGPPREAEIALSGGIVQSVDRRTCRFTVLGIEGTAMYILQSKSGRQEVTIAHRVTDYLEWIEQVVWDEEFPSQQSWKFVTQKSSSAFRKGYSNGLLLLILFIILFTV